jgi:transforming growth factor-beta-induced protein
MKRFSIFSVLVALALFVAACAPAATPAPTTAPTEAMEPTAAPTQPPTPEPQTIVDIAQADGNFSTLVAALDAAGLVDTLQGEGPFTVFAPTDAAFAKLPAGTVETLLGDIPTLSNILLYHVASGKLMAAEVAGMESLPMLSGQDAKISVDGNIVKINDAQIVTTDIEASNGVIHVIDSVILPSEESPQAGADSGMAEMGSIVDIAAANENFSTLVTALQAAGLVETLQGDGPFTVFAPTNDAFAALPAEALDSLLADPEALTNVLLYHVVPAKAMAADVVNLPYADTALGQPVLFKMDGDQVMVNDAAVTTADLEASNGVIHVIDKVLLPPTMDIVDTAVADGRFTTLVTAVEATGLTDALKAEGPLTVFAPTDEAFAKLPAGTVDALVEDLPALTNILLYHVVDGRVLAADVAKLASATTLNGQDVTVTVAEDGTVKINDATVVITDILTTNGVIHVIDTVLLPQ